MAAMRRRAMAVAMWLALAAGCNGEPVYRGVSFVTYNYTPWNLEPVQLRDAAGKVASSSTLTPGGGEGSVSCCYTFSGTDFTVKWSGGDPELLRKHLFDDRFDDFIFKQEAVVNFPVTNLPDGDAPLYLELHIYPDEHMEIALSRNLKGQVRIPIVDTTRWLYEKYGAELTGYDNATQLKHALAKVTKQAWMRYRIEDAEDMRAYMYLYFVVTSDFDKDAQISTVLKDSSRKPGDFGKAVAALSKEKLAQLKASGSTPGDKGV